MYVYGCMYVWVRVCMYVCTYKCVYVCMYVCMYIKLCVCVYVCMYVHKSVCMCVWLIALLLRALWYYFVIAWKPSFNWSFCYKNLY